MQSIKHISIAEPCHQNWLNMTETTKGRYCSSCDKIVTDFTGMTNQQIISIISNANNVCGRLEEWQLNSINQQLKQPQSSWFNWKRIGLATCLVFIFSITKVKAQQTKAKVKYGRYLQIKNKHA